MALYTIGGLRCDLAPFNVHGARGTREMPFAEHDVLGARPVHERMVDARQTLTLTGRLFPFRLGGLDELAVLERMVDRGEPVFVLRGGRSLGWFVVASAEDRHSYLKRSGIGAKIEVSITLERTTQPAPEAALGAFLELFTLG